MPSDARGVEQRTEQRLDRRVLSALLASTIITLLLVAPYLLNAL